jgi:hypothetical protein
LAPQKAIEEGVRTLSVDEKTGIQALERNAPDLPMDIGMNRKREYEYTRHGTLCLIANWDVVNGGVVNPTIGPTRTEEDFLNHIKTTTAADPTVKKWCFVLDNLNTHQSESLTRWVAQLVGTSEAEMGKKGKKGILKNMETRAAFLSDPTHKVYFVYTPKHCSWLNQIEIWFGILSKRLLRFGNFYSLEDLQEQIEKFIVYFNETMAKPFKWTYNGKPLAK